MTRIRTSTGVKKKTVIAKLNINFAKDVPYDPIHLVYEGAVNTSIQLMFGTHPKTNPSLAYVIGDGDQNDVNQALECCKIVFPPTWGRYPLPITDICRYKAETFKNFALYFEVPIIYALFPRSSSKVLLWVHLRNMIEIISNPTPQATDIFRLKIFVQAFHSTFSDLFYIDCHHGFCFTPTTYTILHLPDMLKSCGLLLNVSQFLSERVIGELAKYVKCPRHIESNLLNERLYLFGLRMLDGGIRRTFACSKQNEQNVVDSIVGANISSGPHDPIVNTNGT